MPPPATVAVDCQSSEATGAGDTCGGAARSGIGLVFRTDGGVSFVDRAPDATNRPSVNPSTCAVGVTGTGTDARLTLSPGRIDPTNAAFKDSRRPLVGEVRHNNRARFVIGNHCNSKGGRAALREGLAADVVLGDHNDFPLSPPITILFGTGGGQTCITLWRRSRRSSGTPRAVA